MTMICVPSFKYMLTSHIVRVCTMYVPTKISALGGVVWDTGLCYPLRIC